MIEQLKELLEMQYIIDKSIATEKGFKKYPLEEMRVALFVELGELMQELPSYFKVWKNNKVDNREKALEEYVDCLAFKMNIFNYQMQYKDRNSIPLPKYEECELGRCDLLPLLRDTILWDSFYYLFALGNRLGFTWNEIYDEYKRKYQINITRIDNGY